MMSAISSVSPAILCWKAYHDSGQNNQNGSLGVLLTSSESSASSNTQRKAGTSIAESLSKPNTYSREPTQDLLLPILPASRRNFTTTCIVSEARRKTESRSSSWDYLPTAPAAMTLLPISFVYC